MYKTSTVHFTAQEFSDAAVRIANGATWLDMVDWLATLDHAEEFEREGVWLIQRFSAAYARVKLQLERDHDIYLPLFPRPKRRSVVDELASIIGKRELVAEQY